ncbi:superfamily II DNA or RNA helicase [Microbacterium marinum]|uniref:Superfamily II DNA or RNA helicase n=1 Tax=Microbacterium marinum TaxID=421115 RepID=A0A7W7BSF9_9MICO|nr:helicase-related protein [Microbacterium marinum]MBB4667994.1 superfamily II DNA or RNA helicase [Microbacterium marinum]
MISFGYHPIPDDLGVVLSRGGFSRAVIVDESVDHLYDAVPVVRTSQDSESGLPAGLYWFEGIGSPIVMQVGSGPTGSSAQLTLESWDDTVEHPLFEALNWAEHLWETGDPVPAPRFGVGERVLTVPGGADVEIRTRAFDRRAWSYRVFGDGGLRMELEHKLAPIEAADQPDEWVLGPAASAARFGATLTRAKLRGRFADTIYSFRATRTVFRPYQFKPVLKLLQTGQARILIADEVGLGKTIEAGLIWTELEARHEADRVLIVCPSVLVDKWRDEMEERFGFDLVQLDREELERFLAQHREGRVPKRRSYVVSLETLRTWDALDELRDNPPEFDLVIVDEAHSMRNSDTKSYQLGTQLSEWTIGSNMVFLTATPINLRQTDLLHLLGLLEPADFDTIEDLEARLEPNAVLNEVGRMLPRQDVRGSDFDSVLGGLKGLVFERSLTQRPEFAELSGILRRAPLPPKDVADARRLLGELNALSTTVTRTRRAEVDERKAVRDAEPGIEVVWHPAEAAFYEEYLKWCARRADVARTPMYFSMQMPIRLASTSIHLAARDVLGSDPEVWEGDADKAHRPSWVEPHPELINAAKRVLEVPDSKLEVLGGVLSELHTLGRQALLFTWSKANLRNLKATFQGRYRIAVLNGDVKRDQRRKIMKDFRAGHYDFLFANRVASEGLDFEFCSAVINYDLPWNPMEIEQRIGRIDRIGQQSEKILIRNFYNDGAIDSRIMFRVLERIQIFEQSIGELEPIIGQHMDVLREAMDFRLTRSQQDEKARQFLTAIEAQRQGLRQVADSAASLIIANDVEVAGLVDELVSTGRYLGQAELAHLLDDWAQSDGGDGLARGGDGRTVELRGNPAMAARILELIRRGRRNRSETGSLVTDLQNDIPIHLALDPELARTSGIELLSANHPLVMAAAEVPGHRHARFAYVSIRADGDVAPGNYLIVLAHAENASRGGDEIWGASIDFTGKTMGSSPADALLAALARGTMGKGRPIDTGPLPRLANRAKRELELRHREVQDRRDIEEGALAEARRAILADQHARRMKGIHRRMQTMLERDRGRSVLRMVEGQKRRQQERYEALAAELDAQRPEAVSLRYLAVCVLEVLQ